MSTFDRIAGRRNVLSPDIKTGNPLLDRAIEGARLSIGQLDRMPFSQGALSAGILVEPGENIIPHGLSHRPRGWWVTRFRGGAPRLFEKASDENFILLQADAPAVVDLWAF